MTYLWSGMIIIGIIYGALTGNLKAVTEAAVSSGKDAVTLCISMAGMVAMWSGLMKIAEMAGIVEKLSGKLRPVMRFLFPDLDPDSEEDRRIEISKKKWKGNKSEQRTGIASKEMCTFLIINISSLQLIPVNMIAYRAQYGSADPAAVVGPGMVATAVSTVTAVIFCRIMNRRGER